MSRNDGGWHSWIVQQGGGGLATVPAPPRAFATKAKSSKTKTPVKATLAPAPAKKRAPKPTITLTTPTANMPVLDSSLSATPVFTVSGELLCQCVLTRKHGTRCSRSPTTATSYAPPPATNSTTPETAQTQKHRYVFIGKPRKAWGRLVSLPDPEPDQFERMGKGKGIARRGRRSNKRTLFFVGSLEPLLLARRLKRRRRRSASLDGNVDNRPGEDGEGYEDADADGDTDDGEGEGIWPGEFVVPTIVVTEPDAEPKMEMVGTRITPEEVERAIGAAFAA